MEKNPTYRPSYLLVVAAALLDETRRILVQKRPEGKSMAGLWEFPGGKVEPGETPETALARELKEELDIEVCPDDLKPAAFASEPLGDRHLLLLLYSCESWIGTPRSLEKSETSWSDINSLYLLDMPPADRPLLDQLSQLYRKNIPVDHDSES